MPFLPNTFIQPVLDKVLGFSGGRFDPFQQAHQIGDTALRIRTEVLFEALNVDELGNPLPENDPRRLTVDQSWNGFLAPSGSSADGRSAASRRVRIHCEPPSQSPNNGAHECTPYLIATFQH